MDEYPMRGLLLASDLDGTLITATGAIPRRNLAAIDRFIRRGGRFALATGRSVHGAEKYAAKIPADAPAIVYGGGGIYDFTGKKQLWGRYLPRGYIDLVREAAGRFPGLGIEAYTGGGVFYLRKNVYTKQHTAFQSITAEDGSMEDPPKNCNKVLFCGDSDEIGELAAFLAGQPHPGCTFTASASNFLDVLPEGVTKGVAVRALADMLGIGREGIMSIGDYYNDLELFAASALCAAPGDAPAEVRAAAHVVTGPCEDGAVADFIEIIEARYS